MTDIDLDKNEHLRAAAPMLYQALVVIRDNDEERRESNLSAMPDAVRKMIDFAIAKAEGKS
jgi:hypothetical protein